MNSFNESYTLRSPHSCGHRSRSNDESHLTRVGYDTVERLIHRSAMERWFYVIVLTTLLGLFVLIYLTFTGSPGFASAKLVAGNDTFNDFLSSGRNVPMEIKDSRTTRNSTSKRPRIIISYLTPATTRFSTSSTSVPLPMIEVRTSTVTTNDAKIPISQPTSATSTEALSIGSVFVPINNSTLVPNSSEPEGYTDMTSARATTPTERATETNPNTYKSSTVPANVFSSLILLSTDSSTASISWAAISSQFTLQTEPTVLDSRTTKVESTFSSLTDSTTVTSFEASKTSAQTATTDHSIAEDLSWHGGLPPLMNTSLTDTNPISTTLLSPTTTEAPNLTSETNSIGIASYPPTTSTSLTDAARIETTTSTTFELPSETTEMTFDSVVETTSTSTTAETSKTPPPSSITSTSQSTTETEPEPEDSVILKSEKTFKIETIALLISSEPTETEPEPEDSAILKSEKTFKIKTTALPISSEPTEASTLAQGELLTTKTNEAPTEKNVTHLDPGTKPSMAIISSKIASPIKVEHEPAPDDETTATITATDRGLTGQHIETIEDNLSPTEKEAIRPESSRRSPPLCTLIGLNHLAACNSIFRAPVDYYWFRERRTKDSSSTPITSSNYLRTSMKSPSSSARGKMSKFHRSCLAMDTRENEPISKLRNDKLLNQLMRTISSGKSLLTMEQILKWIETLGLSNGLFHIKPIPDYLDRSGKLIHYIQRDDYPHHKRTSTNYLMDFDHIPKEFFKTLGLPGKQIEFEEVLLAAQDLQEFPPQWAHNRSRLAPKKTHELEKILSGWSSIPNPDWIVENPEGLLERIDDLLHDFKGDDLREFLLWTFYRKNFIHLGQRTNDSAIDLFEPLTKIDLESFCVNMLGLPFGLIYLTNELRYHYPDDPTKLTNNLTSTLADSLRYSLETGFNLTQDQLDQILRQPIKIIEETVDQDQLPLDENQLDKLYESLDITDNYFDNVQGIRGWLSDGYKQGCPLNYASV